MEFYTSILKRDATHVANRLANIDIKYQRQLTFLIEKLQKKNRD